MKSFAKKFVLFLIMSQCIIATDSWCDSSVKHDNVMHQWKEAFKKIFSKDTIHFSIDLLKKMALIYAIDLSSTIVHEYGHALVPHALDYGESKIFIGDMHALPMKEIESEFLNGIRTVGFAKIGKDFHYLYDKKFPTVEFKSFVPNEGFTLSCFLNRKKAQTYKDPIIRPLAGPLAGSLYAFSILCFIKLVEHHQKHKKITAQDFKNIVFSNPVAQPYKVYNLKLFYAESAGELSSFLLSYTEYANLKKYMYPILLVLRAYNHEEPIKDALKHAIDQNLFNLLPIPGFDGYNVVQGLIS